MTENNHYLGEPTNDGCWHAVVKAVQGREVINYLTVIDTCKLILDEYVWELERCIHCSSAHLCLESCDQPRENPGLYQCHSWELMEKSYNGWCTWNLPTKLDVETAKDVAEPLEPRKLNPWPAQ